MNNFKLRIEYDTTDNAPIKSVTSHHIIVDDSDLNVVCGFISDFSEITYGIPELLNGIAKGEVKTGKEIIRFKVLDND